MSDTTAGGDGMSEWKNCYITRDTKCNRGSTIAIWDGAEPPPHFNEMYCGWSTDDDDLSLICEGRHAVAILGGHMHGIRKGQLVRKQIKIEAKVRLWV